MQTDQQIVETLNDLGAVHRGLRELMPLIGDVWASPLDADSGARLGRALSGVDVMEARAARARLMGEKDSGGRAGQVAPSCPATGDGGCG